MIYCYIAYKTLYSDSSINIANLQMITEHTIERNEKWQKYGLEEFRKMQGTYGFNREHFSFYSGCSLNKLHRIYRGAAQLKPYEWAGLLAIAEQHREQIFGRVSPHE